MDATIRRGTDVTTHCVGVLWTSYVAPAERPWVAVAADGPDGSVGRATLMRNSVIPEARSRAAGLPTTSCMRPLDAHTSGSSSSDLKPIQQALNLERAPPSWSGSRSRTNWPRFNWSADL